MLDISMGAAIAIALTAAVRTAKRNMLFQLDK
jgi:hypothetical protein